MDRGLREACHMAVGSFRHYSRNPGDLKWEPIIGLMFFDILKENTSFSVKHRHLIDRIKKVIKSVWWMPWLSEAMKDVAKLR